MVRQYGRRLRWFPAMLRLGVWILAPIFWRWRRMKSWVRNGPRPRARF